MTEPIPDFPGFTAWLLAQDYTRNPHTDACHDTAEHAHLRSPDGRDDLIVWASGAWSWHDLTLKARLIYPSYGRKQPGEGKTGGCYRIDAGPVHVTPGCRC